jgi:hypothetical protein
MEREMGQEKQADVYEQLRAFPEFEESLRGFVGKVVQIRQESWHVNEIEERLLAAQRGLMQELMQTVVEVRGREAQEAVLEGAQIKRHRKKRS